MELTRMVLLEWVQNCALCVVLFVALLRFAAWYFRKFQDQLLYFPRMPENSTNFVPEPSEYGFSCWEKLQILTSDKTVLHGFFLRQEKDWAEAVTVLYFHGNAGNVGHRIPLALSLYRAAACNVVLVEYRGFGLSGGTATEEGLKEDARASLRHVHNLGVNPNAVVVMGTSLGGAVAIHLAAHAELPVAGLIVENTFTSISSMVDVLWELHVRPNVRPLTYHVLTTVFTCLKPVVLHIDWGSAAVVHRVAVPILFLSGKRDELIPPAQMHQLYISARRSPRKQFVSLPAGTHNDTWCCERYHEAVAAFLENNVLRRSSPRVRPIEDLTLEGDLV